MTRTIKFNPVNEFVESGVPHPRPASDYIPEWYKKMGPFFTKDPEFDIESGRPNVTFKKCMPFLDSFTMGYIQETWADIYIEKKDGETFFYYAAGPKIISERAIQNNDTFPKLDEYLPQHYTWHPPWFPELPIGYSCIITQPFNHFNLPYFTFTGIVDADGYTHSEQGSNIPFVLKENFQGMIKKGTPMYQIIPFKRESWQSETAKYDKDKQLNVTYRVQQFMWGGYKKLFWNKKEFK